MTLTGLLMFCAAYALAVATPGPGIAAVVARVLGRGTRGLAAFIAGFIVGDLVWFAVAAGGLSLLAQALDGAFTALRYAGAAYLLYLAWKLWRAPAVAADADIAVPDEAPGRLFLGSLALTLGNPKVIVFFMALLPAVIDLPSLTLGGGLMLAACIMVLITAILGSYALAAARARRLLRSARAVRLLNRGTGAVMAGAAAAIAAR